MEAPRLDWAKTWLRAPKQLYIDGRWRDATSRDSTTVTNPANGTTLATIAAQAAEAGAERTALILIGEALGRDDFRESALYSVDYRRRFRGG